MAPMQLVWVNVGRIGRECDRLRVVPGGFFLRIQDVPIMNTMMTTSCFKTGYGIGSLLGSVCFAAVFILGQPGTSLAQVSGVQAIGTANSYGAGSQIVNRPTVSPYLRLLQSNGGVQTGYGSVSSVYQTQVRPAVQARQEAVLQRGQIDQLQRQVNQVRQDYIQRPGGAMSTGHPTRFRSYLHYYPRLGR